MNDPKLAERLARAALSGFFGDNLGFSNMQTHIRRAATAAVQKELDRLQPREEHDESPQVERHQSEDVTGA